jgi:chromosome segregation ATPase
MIDQTTLRDTIEATRALLREQETALLKSEVSEMEGQHQNLVERCRAAKDEFERLVSETEELSHEVRKGENDTQQALWMLDQYRHDKLPAYATAKEKEERVATINEAQRTFDAAFEAGRDRWARYELLRAKRKQAHDDFTKLADEEGMLGGRLSAKRRELRTINPQASQQIDTSQFENLTYEYRSGGFVARPGDASRQYVGPVRAI